MDTLEDLVKQLPEKEQEDSDAEIEVAEHDPSKAVVSDVLFKVRHRFTTVEWRERWGVLYPHQLCYFKQKKDKEPKQVVVLEGCSLVVEPENSDCPKRAFSFALIHPLRKNVYLAAKDQASLDSWIQSLLSVGVKLSELSGKNLHTQRITMGSGNANPTKKLNFKTRTQKYIASVAAARVGVEIIETFFGESGVELMETLHDFAASQADEDTAQKLEKNILKMAAKIAVLVRNKVISDEQLLAILPTTVRWCNLFISIYTTTPGSTAARTDRSARIEKLIEYGWKIENWLQELIKPHLRDKSSQRIHTVFKFYLDKDVLESLGLIRHYEASQIILDSVIELYHKIYEGNTDFDDGTLQS